MFEFVKKIAQKVAQPIFWINKRTRNGFSIVLKNPVEIKQLINWRKFAQSGHPGHVRHEVVCITAPGLRR
jgi:hypothetical protein